MTQHNLSQPQELAANHLEGPMLVLAGAGSGKTRVVTQRIAKLLEAGVPPSTILAVTFTNKAAQEMRERVEMLTHQKILACTFHSLGAKILRASIAPLGYTKEFVIYDEEDRAKLLKECLVSLGEKPDKGALKSLGSQISAAKNAILSPDAIEDGDEIFIKTYTLYQKRLKSSNALDFDDLLFLPVYLFLHHRDILEEYQNTFRFLLIDEYQDTNFAQHELVRLLSLRHHNIFAVGDPDQSIYSWRGALVKNILNFTKNFPGSKVITLDQNYRSKGRILKVANALIRHNTSRYQKDLWSALGEGDPVTLFIAESDRDEASLVIDRIIAFQKKSKKTFRDCAIFYRTNAQSRTFEDALLRHHIPYLIIGGLSFYARKEIKDILSFLKIIDGGTDFLSFQRTINLPKRGLGESAIAKLYELSLETGLSIFKTVEQITERTLPCKLSEKQFEGLKEYTTLIHSMQNALRAQLPLHELLSLLVEKSHYLLILKEDMETYQDRKENISELLSKAAEWAEETENPSLSLFLEELSLKSALDVTGEDRSDAVCLMTLHHSKGLEFSFVALVGMEEQLFPHINSLESPDAIEEERRLCYVGITRAKEELCLTAAKQRYLWGSPRMMRPSRFLQEIPKECLATVTRSVGSKMGHEFFRRS